MPQAVKEGHYLSYSTAHHNEYLAGNELASAGPPMRRHKTRSRHPGGFRSTGFRTVEPVDMRVTILPKICSQQKCRKQRGNNTERGESNKVWVLRQQLVTLESLGSEEKGEKMHRHSYNVIRHICVSSGDCTFPFNC